MPKAGFYAVARGHAPGIYSTWADCQQAISGFSRPSFKKFNSQREAEDFIRTNGDATAKAALKQDSRPGPTDAASTSRTPPAVILVHRPSSSPGSAKGAVLVPARPHSKKKKAEGKKPKSKTPAPFPAVPSDEEHTWQVVCGTGAFSASKDGTSSAGIGVWFGAGDARNVSERCPGAQTHNRADLISIIRALELAPYNDKPLLVKTASDYCLKCIHEWMPQWLRRDGFKTSAGTPPKNIDLVRYLAALLALRDVRFRGHGVRLQYDPANSARALAHVARSLPASTIAESYWVDSRTSVEKEIKIILDSRPAQPSAAPANDRGASPLPEDDRDDYGFDYFPDDDGAWMDALCDF